MSEERKLYSDTPHGHVYRITVSERRMQDARYLQDKLRNEDARGFSGTYRQSIGQEVHPEEQLREVKLTVTEREITVEGYIPEEGTYRLSATPEKLKGIGPLENLFEKKTACLTEHPTVYFDPEADPAEIETVLADEDVEAWEQHREGEA